MRLITGLLKWLCLRIENLVVYYSFLLQEVVSHVNPTQAKDHRSEVSSIHLRYTLLQSHIVYSSFHSKAEYIVQGSQSARTQGGNQCFSARSQLNYIEFDPLHRD